MMIIVWAVLILIGYSSTRLRWQAFAGIAAFALIGTVAMSALRSIDRSRLDYGQSNYWAPENLAANAAINFVIYSILFLAGYGIGALMRRRKRDRPEGE